MGTKIGIGIVTCDRPAYFKRCINSIPDGVGTVVVVNDGKPYDNSLYPSKIMEVIQHRSNMCVGISKNEALTHLIKSDCDYLFLIEDDTEILRPDVFDTYIKTAELSGLWHMNFGPGSPFNRRQTTIKYDLYDRNLLDKYSTPNPRLIIQYAGGAQVALYKHSVAMFSFFVKDIIEKIGFHDEMYINAWEHVDLTYRIIKAGMHPPFWWFADVWDSTQFLKEIEGALENSTISKDAIKWEENIVKGREYYKQVHGHYPNEVRDASEEEVKRILSSIKIKFAKC